MNERVEDVIELEHAPHDSSDEDDDIEKQDMEQKRKLEKKK